MDVTGGKKSDKGKDALHSLGKRGRRSLVLCFDGTGNKFQGTNEDSNILKIYSLLQHENVDQFSYYQPGIGTYNEHRGLNRASGRYTRFKSWWTKQKDMMVGTSFADHVMAGYKFLMQYYKNEDEIFMFGFSRGAYTARFLAEMLDYVGLLKAGNEEMVRFTWKCFSNWQTRKTGGSKEDKEKNEKTYEFMKKFRETFSRPIRPIRFLGLFDTVNSVPFFEVAWMQRTKFPYTARTSAKVIRHAVSIDERRAKFRQDLIADKSNVHERQHHFRQWARELRKAHEEGRPPRDQDHEVQQDTDSDADDVQGLEKREFKKRESSGYRFRPIFKHSHETNKDAKSEDTEKDGEGKRNPKDEDSSEDELSDDDNDDQDIQEVWFSGGHGDIGGGWAILPTEPPNPASHISLLWMIREGLRAGVPFDTNKLKSGNYFPHNTVPSHQEGIDTNEDLRKTFHESIRVAEGARMHDTLSFGQGTPWGGVAAWQLLEHLPFRRMDLQGDGSWKPIRWPLPAGETRDMPKGAVIHGSVMRRMKADKTYRPGNLIIGGGGRVARRAPEKYGTGKWRCVREEGELLGECWVREDAEETAGEALVAGNVREK